MVKLSMFQSIQSGGSSIKCVEIEDSEKALDVEKLIQDAIDNIEVEDIEF